MAVTTALILDLNELFKNQFGSKPYVISKADSFKDLGSRPRVTLIAPPLAEITPAGSTLREQYLGVDIFLPIRLFDDSGTQELMHLPYCVIRISGKNTYISTPMIDRKGAVHELASSDDYSIEIKGFLIGANRKFPEAELKQLKAIKERKTALVIDNALTNIFLTDPELSDREQRRVVITDLELPDVQGSEHVRPFVIKMLSDTVFDLDAPANV